MKKTKLKRSPSDPKKVRTHLKDLTEAVIVAVAALDKALTEPESAERGRQLARITNWLELYNDAARYFGLDVDFRTDKKQTSRRLYFDGPRRGNTPFVEFTMNVLNDLKQLPGYSHKDYTTTVGLEELQRILVRRLWELTEAFSFVTIDEKPGQVTK